MGNIISTEDELEASIAIPVEAVVVNNEEEANIQNVYTDESDATLTSAIVMSSVNNANENNIACATARVLDDGLNSSHSPSKHRMSLMNPDVELSTTESATSSSSSAASSTTTSQINTLFVMFSAPLAWRDRKNKLHPLEALDYPTERDALVQVKYMLLM
jgi:hypothetical protein